MNSIADGSVIIQTSSQSVPSTPPWFGEVALIAQHRRRAGYPCRHRCIPLPLPSWRSSGGSACPHARRSVAFLPVSPRRRSKALRTLFLEDLLARPLNKERQTGGLVDRAGRDRVVFDIDGTREAARQRALPKTPDRPAAERRLRSLCAPATPGASAGKSCCALTLNLPAFSIGYMQPFR